MFSLLHATARRLHGSSRHAAPLYHLIPAPPLPSPPGHSPSHSSAPKALDVFLPHGYPHSVSPRYLHYSLWSSSASVFSSAAGVVATSSLLMALGLGASGALPLSAATTWVLKDGLGQLGGVVYAAVMGTSFDADPKRWRQVSALAQDGAGALEVSLLALAPILPLPFLPAAALANVARNVSWLSASATRAGLHSSLARGGNLADVTAKAGSQTTAACTLGTALGVALTSSLASYFAPPSTAVAVAEALEGATAAAASAAAAVEATAAAGVEGGVATLALYATLAMAHNACVYASLRAVPLVTLSPARLHLAWEEEVGAAAAAGTAAFPASGDTGVKAGVPGAAAPAAFPRLRDPAQVCALERFLPWETSNAPTSVVVLMPTSAATSLPPTSDCSQQEFSEFIASSSSTCTSPPLQPPPYALAVGGQQGRVYLALGEGLKGAEGVLLAYLHAAHVAAWVQQQQHVEKMTAQGGGGGVQKGDGLPLEARLAAVARGRMWVEGHGRRVLEGLEARGWRVREPLVEGVLGGSRWRFQAVVKETP